MCGIAGIISFPGARPVPADVLQAMTNAMAHRGPDGAAVWLSPDGRIGFGHRRLAIVDLSPAGAQPMSNADGTLVVTYNGEIYNFPELRRDLEARGYRFRSHSDTEVLLYLYERHGEGMLDLLDGDFAFALWDARRRRVLLARDPAGLKPLYVVRQPDKLLFASEIKALLLHPDVAPVIDEESFANALTYLVTPAPRTLLRDVEKLPNGHCLTVDLASEGTRLIERTYFDPLPRQMELAGADCDAMLEELFDRSVSKRLMSDVPVGVLFSGGVDSTLNAASFQKRIAPARVRTYTVGAADATQFEDESAHARMMAARLGTEHHEIKITAADMLAAAEHLAFQQDEPISDPVSIPLYFVTRLARDDGTIVLHAGEGADELFCGYAKYIRFLKFHRRLWQPLQALPPWVSGLGARLFAAIGGATADKVADALMRRQRGQEFFLSSSIAFYDHERASVLSPDARRRLSPVTAFSAVERYYQQLRAAVPDATPLETMTYIELRLRLPELLLMRIDKMAMANSVEVRAPFLDKALIRFATSLPETFKLRDGIAKEPIKRLALRHVERDLIYRPKRGFGAPIMDWFRGPLRDPLLDLAGDPAGEGPQLFDRTALESRLKDGPKTVNQAFQLWVIYNFLLWRKSTRAVSPLRSAA